MAKCYATDLKFLGLKCYNKLYLAFQFKYLQLPLDEKGKFMEHAVQKTGSRWSTVTIIGKINKSGKPN